MRRVVQQQILDDNGWKQHKGWAFGLGLERLAMVKFQIDDIRLFWSSDQRFLRQFRAGDLGAVFKPYSKYPPVFKVWGAALQDSQGSCAAVLWQELVHAARAHMHVSCMAFQT